MMINRVDARFMGLLNTLMSYLLTVHEMLIGHDCHGLHSHH